MEPDAVLVQRTIEGDARAFEGLVRRYLRPAHAVALAVVREPADAEDVCQEAFITALERIEECRQTPSRPARGRARPVTWTARS
jgi:RNA polymerase sigma-70 factor (ECF subfamily)